MPDSTKTPTPNIATDQPRLDNRPSVEGKSKAAQLDPVTASSPPDVSNESATDAQQAVGPNVPDPNLASPAAQKQSDRVGVKRKLKPANEIANLEQFIAFAYSRKGQRVVLNPQVERRIRQQPKLEDDARERLLELARTDVLLAVPRQLLLVARVVEYPALKGSLREFVGTVLEMHPVFSTEELSAAVRNLPEAPDIGRALAMVAKVDCVNLPGVAAKKPLKKTQLATLRTNATYCLAVWFAETRGLSSEQLSRCLFSSVWQPQSAHIRDDSTRLRLLTEIHDLAGVGMACEAFKSEATEQRRVAEAARSAEAVATERVQSLEAALEQLKQDIKVRDEQINMLRSEIERLKQRYENDQAHLRDDYEQLRTRILRRLKADVSLLDEGLDALRRDKGHVMVDHAERALDGLRSEIKRLQSGD